MSSCHCTDAADAETWPFRTGSPEQWKELSILLNSGVLGPSFVSMAQGTANSSKVRRVDRRRMEWKRKQTKVKSIFRDRWKILQATQKRYVATHWRKIIEWVDPFNKKTIDQPVNRSWPVYNFLSAPPGPSLLPVRMYTRNLARPIREENSELDAFRLLMFMILHFLLLLLVVLDYG